MRSAFVRFSIIPALALTLLGCNEPIPNSNPALDAYAPSLGVNIASMTKISDDLYIQDITVGTGATLALGDVIAVKYTGYLPNGGSFDSSNSYSFQYGTTVIDGWTQGLAGMKIGGQRRLVIGSRLGYGESGSGVIPPNTTIIFVVTLLSKS